MKAITSLIIVALALQAVTGCGTPISQKASRSDAATNIGFDTSGASPNDSNAKREKIETILTFLKELPNASNTIEGYLRHRVKSGQLDVREADRIRAKVDLSRYWELVVDFYDERMDLQDVEALFSFLSSPSGAEYFIALRECLKLQDQQEFQECTKQMREADPEGWKQTFAFWRSPAMLRFSELQREFYPTRKEHLLAAVEAATVPMNQ